MMKRFWIAFLALALCAVFLSGCLEAGITTQVNDDGTGTRVITVTIPQSLRSVMESESEDTPPLLAQMLFPPAGNWQVQKSEAGEMIRYEGTRRFAEASQLSSEISTVELARESSLFRSTYHYTETFRLDPARLNLGLMAEDQMNSLLGAVAIHDEVLLPGKITESSVQIAETDKVTADFTASQLLTGVTITASSQAVRWEIVVILIAVLMIIFIIVVLQILRSASRRGDAVVETVDLE